MIPPELLASFVAFGELRSFTRAARALHLSQPAVHAQVRRLGELLGVPLYVRAGRGVELTAEGVRVLAHARESAERERALVRSLRGGDGRAEPVVLAAGEGATLHLLGPALRRFHARGKAPLRVLTRGGEAAIECVRRGEAHLAVAATPSVPDGLSHAALATVGSVLAMPRGHALARKRRARLADLEGARLVVPPLPGPHRIALSRALEAEGVRWEVGVEAQGWEVMLRFVELGLGLAVVNEFCRLPSRVIARPLSGLPTITYRLVWARALSPAVAELAAELRAVSGAAARSPR